MQARTGATKQHSADARLTHGCRSLRAYVVQLDMRKRIKGNMAKGEINMGEGPEPEGGAEPPSASQIAKGQR